MEARLLILSSDYDETDAVIRMSSFLQYCWGLRVQIENPLLYVGTAQTRNEFVGLGLGSE